MEATKTSEGGQDRLPWRKKSSEDLPWTDGHADQGQRTRTAGRCRQPSDSGSGDSLSEVITGKLKNIGYIKYFYFSVVSFKLFPEKRCNQCFREYRRQIFQIVGLTCKNRDVIIYTFLIFLQLDVNKANCIKI